jgi:ABC-type multidrug transport system fused ATPase/permease subunit
VRKGSDPFLEARGLTPVPDPVHERSRFDYSVRGMETKPRGARVHERSAGAGSWQIVIEGVNHLYRPPAGRPVLALEDVSLQVRSREFLALLGPSGCGKSTLLYLIGGFLPTEKGSIRLDGRPIAGPGPDRGIVFQHFALFPWKTVRSNVLYGPFIISSRLTFFYSVEYTYQQWRWPCNHGGFSDQG